MPLYRPSESVQHAQPTDKAQLRQRKLLPPLAAPPTELSMAALDPAHDDDDDAETKADEEQMLRNHSGFARAFKLNDAAMLLPFLDKDVVLHAHDGAEYEGISAVLGCLVGPRMTKLSSALHVKGRPMRSAPWQSAFVYEHGLVFREPLYSEVVDWKPHAGVITHITHTRLSNPNDVGPPKSVSDVVKVVATIPHRLSLSDEDDNAASRGRRSSSGRASLTAVKTSNSPTASGDAGVLVTRIAVLTKLSPIRKRKIVNAFITVEDDAGRIVWKSTVAKKQTLPVWSGIDLAIPPLVEEDMNPGNESRELLQNLANAHTPVTVTLWDYGFFRSLRVATTQVTAAQLLGHERAGLTSIELKPMGFSAQPVQLSFSIIRQEGDTDWRPRRSSVVSTVAAIDAALGIEESSTAVVQKAPGVDGTFIFVSGFSLLVVLCCVLIWQRMLSPLMAE